METIEEKMCSHEADQQRSWSDLPLNILELISDHLIGPDHFYFLSVCKHWSSIYFSIETSLKNNIQVPVLVYLKSDSTINFFNPILCTTHKIANSNYKKITAEIAKFNNEIGEKSDHHGRFNNYSRDQEKRICFAKEGWLLLSQGESRVFFFNPITEQRIDLPEEDSLKFAIGRISFSTAPTSSDCMVIGIKFNPTFVNVLCIRRGQDTWIQHMISTDQEFRSSYSSPVFHSGFFYLMESTGNLIIYNPERGEEVDALQVLQKSEPCASVQDCYLIEYNGKVVSVFTGFMGRWAKAYQLDDSSNWKKTNDLDDNILFVSRLASLSATATDLKVSGLKSRVYFPRYSTRNGNGIFYNLPASTFQTLWGNQEDFYNSNTFLNCAWIKPNLHMYVDEELNWLLPVA